MRRPKDQDLASALMAEITARLEDLSAASVRHHVKPTTADDLSFGLEAVQRLVDAYNVLVSAAERSSQQRKRARR